MEAEVSSTSSSRIRDFLARSARAYAPALVTAWRWLIERPIFWTYARQATDPGQRHTATRRFSSAATYRATRRFFVSQRARLRP